MLDSYWQNENYERQNTHTTILNYTLEMFSLAPLNVECSRLSFLRSWSDLGSIPTAIDRPIPRFRSPCWKIVTEPSIKGIGKVKRRGRSELKQKIAGQSLGTTDKLKTAEGCCPKARASFIQTLNNNKMSYKGRVECFAARSWRSLTRWLIRRMIN